MAANQPQRGRLLLLKFGDAATGQVIKGLKEVTVSQNNSVIDVSTKDTDGWRELLEDGSLKMFSVSVSGIFKDNPTDELIRAANFNNTLNTYTIMFPNGDTIECDFQITGWQTAGSEQGAQTYSYTLESTGEPTFTAA